MKSVWRFVLSEVIAGTIILNWIICLWLYIKTEGDLAFFLTMMWYLIIFVLAWNSIYNAMKGGGDNDGKKH